MPADQNELHELRERIAKLTPGDQLLLVGQVLDNIRYSHFTDEEEIRQEIRSLGEWYSTQRRNDPAGGAKREAG